MRTYLSLGAAALAIALLSACSTTISTRASEKPAGPLVMRDGLGQEHDVDAVLRDGKSVVLVFWQTWCMTCREEGPALAEAARTQKDLRFFGVVSGGDDAVQQTELDSVAAQLDLPYPQIRDRDGAIADRFGVVGTPTIIVLGPDGGVRYRGSRLPADWKNLAP